MFDKFKSLSSFLDPPPTVPLSLPGLFDDSALLSLSLFPSVDMLLLNVWI